MSFFAAIPCYHFSSHGPMVMDIARIVNSISMIHHTFRKVSQILKTPGNGAYQSCPGDKPGAIAAYTHEVVSHENKWRKSHVEVG